MVARAPSLGCGSCEMDSEMDYKLGVTPKEEL
jgi:hypothetical protein